MGVRSSKCWKTDHILRGLDLDQLSGLLDALEWFFADLPDGVFEDEEKDRRWVECKRASLLGLSQDSAGRNGEAFGTLASEVGEWFVEYST